MYALGDLGQQCTPGTRFRIIAEKGARRISCPSGTSQESGGKLGTGQQYLWCFRPGRCPQPATTTVSYEAPRTTVQVPTAISTQVSPQISPILAQQQASPGAGITGAPVAMPGPVSATPSTGITARDLERILAAQAAAAAAEREAEERKGQTEVETLRREMAARERASQEIWQAQLKADADRAEADRFAREQAEATARESAGAVPAPSSMTYSPTGGGTLPFMPPTIAAPVSTQARDVSVTAGAAEAGTPWALILLAAAGVGAVVIMGGKGKRKSRAKK